MKIRSVLPLAAVMLGVAAPVASAHAPSAHGRSDHARSDHARPHGYAHTYPVASSLCARVAAGHVPRQLAADTAQITAACTTLGNSYAQALSTYQAAVTPIAAQVQSVRASVEAARQAAQQSHDWSTYAAAVQQAQTTLRSLRTQVRAAQQAYVASIRAARQTFWTTIHALRGAGSVPGDGGTLTPPPGPHVPVNV